MSLMTITTQEQISADRLTALFLKHKDNKNLLPYASTTPDNSYSGWVSDFRLTDPSGNRIKLDLRDGQDLFLLFVLAIGWSRSGSWENPAFMVAQLKMLNKHSTTYWMDKSNCQLEKQQCNQAAVDAVAMLQGYKTRKKVSYREDIYDSIYILANKWTQILEALEQAHKVADFQLFMEYMRSIEGLGYGKRRMLMKIPLILRELRCQSIYLTIPGEYCCVPDARVVEAAKALKIKLPTAITFTGLKASSAKIYQLFGDLYDLPLFAYPDLLLAEADSQ